MPPDSVLTEGCNRGYSRGACDRFPAGSTIDAVRFHVAGTTVDTFQIQYVLERDGWPAADGVLIYSRVEQRFPDAHNDPVLQRQAEAFLESYLRRSI